ncbi:MAG: DEAD/DEAH box helicase [Treponema sp.]|jgi:ATP-dependent RNA helicase RhlB|nr:DEAD/DEAH box helicase [Treponema sp.]
MEFTELNLHPDLQRGITESGYITCTPVQEQVLVHAFGGQDLYVQSQTGTGKTAAYLIVILQRLLNESPLHGKKALIMAPTRELAVQIEEEAKLIGTYLPFKIGSFYGGVGYGLQQRLLKDNAQILVGTPGRVLDLNQNGQMNLMDIAFLVLDEADRMFDMGFYPDLRKLIKVVSPIDQRQTMLFSATLNAWVKNLAWEYTKSPFEIAVEPESVTVEEAEQLLYHVPSENKIKLLLGIMRQEQPESAVIFCNTKRYVEILAKRLQLNGFECEFIIGDLPQAKRLKIIEDVKAGAVRYLVATDVAARGLDIEGLSLVVNYDLPTEAENYVHRIGRTARAGKTGKAITLASEQDVYALPAIERYIGKKIPSETASSESYGEDWSEGMRLHTDLYDEQRSHREERAGRGRSAEKRGNESRQWRNPERSAQSGPKHNAPERSVSAASGRHTRSMKQRGTKKRGVTQARTETRSDGQTDRYDLSKLSFDERMAYYRQKYGGAGKQAERSKPRRKKPEQEDITRAAPVEPQTTPLSATPPPAPVVQAHTDAEVKPVQKKGVLSRILNLFRK